MIAVWVKIPYFSDHFHRIFSLNSRNDFHNLVSSQEFLGPSQNFEIRFQSEGYSRTNFQLVYVFKTMDSKMPIKHHHQTVRQQQEQPQQQPSQHQPQLQQPLQQSHQQPISPAYHKCQSRKSVTDTERPTPYHRGNCILITSFLLYFVKNVK